MSNVGTNRRSFLGLLTHLVLATIGFLIAIPAIRYLLSPLWAKADTADGAIFVDVGPLADIRPEEWRLVPVEVTRQDGWKKTQVRHSVWVRREGEGEQGVTVLSSICPHLGCPVNWHPDQKQFFCPCHGGTFDADGRKVAGPPPRSLDPLKFEVRAGRLYVRWQDFKIGVAEGVPVSV
jgi:menaquinol-cytochrome c reductase iron-sulfur subunit